MKTDISSFEVMQTAKISTSSRQKSCFHSKMQRIKQTTRSYVLSWHKIAIVEICIFPVFNLQMLGFGYAFLSSQAL